VREKGLRSASPASASVSASRARPDSLYQLRRELESVDRGIVVLLATRLALAQRAIRVRTSKGADPTDLAQERRVLERGRQWARRLGVPEELVDDLFRTLVEEGKTRFRSTEATAGPLPGPVPAPTDDPTGLRDAPRAKFVRVPAGR